MPAMRMMSKATSKTEVVPSASYQTDGTIVLGSYTLTATSCVVKGKPSLEEHTDVGAFIQRAVKRSGWWLADWLRYGESREDWGERVDQAVINTGLAPKTLRNIRAVAAIEKSRRRDGVEFSTHAEVAALEPTEQTKWLAEAEANGWTSHELRANIKSAKRRRVIQGQARLEGVYRVLYADPPWAYGNKPPSGSGAQAHYNGMTIAQLCDLPIQSHIGKDAVLFLWVTAPMLLENPGPREVIEAWGFKPKTGIVWDKVMHGWGNYVSVRHEHLIICTRGSCLPDRPTPMPDSVMTVRNDGEHSEKPKEFRKLIEDLYDGPRLELFAREKHKGWSSFGDDAALWADQVNG